MKLIMTLLVRDEEDVLGANLECHLAQGVDFFIITDNLSVDGTRGIIDQYVRAGVAVCIDERTDDYSQAKWVTRMARLAAAQYAADWVINSDADEFWLGAGAGETIKDVLERIDPHVQSIVAPRSNFPAVDEDGAGFFAKRMLLRDRDSRNALGRPLLPKVLHRAFRDIEVDQGNHQVWRGGVVVPASGGPFRILHYPVRSFSQFDNKVAKGGAAYARNRELAFGVGDVWRYLYALRQAGDLRHKYRQLMLSPERVEADLRSGNLVYDDTLISLLRDAHTAGTALSPTAS